VSWQATGWAAKQKTGGPSGKSILLILANYADPFGVSWPSQELMADQTEQSVDTVQRRLKDLTKLDLIKVETRAYRPRGGTVGHIYYLQMPKSELEATPQDAVSTEDSTPQFAVSHTAPGPETTPQLCGTEESTEPLIEPSLSERGARPDNEGSASEPFNGSQSEPLPETGSSSEPISSPCLSAFMAKWPTAASDDQAKAQRAWGALSLDERAAALDGIQPFLARLKADKRDHVPASWKYLDEKRWALIVASSSSIHEFHSWSRDWWGVLFAKIEKGERASAWFAYADQGGSPAKKFCAVKAEAMPSLGQLAILTDYLSDGDEMAAWRPWFEQHALRLPLWSDRFRVYLPSATPPSGRQSVWSRRDVASKTSTVTVEAHQTTEARSA